MFQLMVHKEVTNKLRNDYNRMAEIFLKLESEKRSHFEEVNVFINNKSLEFIFNNPDTSINCEWLKEEYEGFITKNKDFERICGREFTDIWNANTISFLQYLDANSKMFEAALIQVKKTGNDYKCRPELWLAEN